MKTHVSISVFAADILNIGNEIKTVKEHDADSIHIDVMDGHFVPMFGFNSVWAKELGNYVCLNRDIHFMLYPTEEIIERFMDTGVETITLHLNSAPDEQLFHCLSYINKNGIKRGIAISPDTKVERVIPFLDKVEEVLIMSTMPGKENSLFVENTYERIRKIKALIGERHIKIAIDGGLNAERSKRCIANGAGKIIIGRTYFEQPHKKDLIRGIHELV